MDQQTVSKPPPGATTFKPELNVTTTDGMLSYTILIGTGPARVAVSLADARCLADELPSQLGRLLRIAEGIQADSAGEAL